MTTPRAGRWLKLDRGKEHLMTLNGELETVLAKEGPAIPLSAAFDPNDQSWVCRVGAFERVGDPSLGGLIGDVAHNLRGALDYLIWDLAILDGGTWPMDKKGREWRTQFPICIDKDGPYAFDSDGVQSIQLDSISQPHRAELERFQPYVTGSDALVLLAKASNEDKHRVIQTVFATDMASVPRIWGTRDCEVIPGKLPVIQHRLEPNTEILRLALTNVGPKPHVDMGFETAIFVAFRDGTPVGSHLGKCAEIVEEILGVFEAELSSPEAQANREAADAAHLS